MTAALSLTLILRSDREAHCVMADIAPRAMPQLVCQLHWPCSQTHVCWQTRIAMLVLIYATAAFCPASHDCCVQLHSSIEKADKVAAGITELSRFMLQQADMSASQAEALDTSVVDADAGLANVGRFSPLSA